MPPSTRQSTRSTEPKASPEPIAEMKNSAAATIMARWRPIRSERLPPAQAPIMQPSSAEETVKPTAMSERPNWAWMGPTAPLITAVSKPKRKPPNAATRTTHATPPMPESCEREVVLICGWFLCRSGMRAFFGEGEPE